MKTSFELFSVSIGPAIVMSLLAFMREDRKLKYFIMAKIKLFVVLILALAINAQSFQMDTFLTVPSTCVLRVSNTAQVACYA